MCKRLFSALPMGPVLLVVALAFPAAGGAVDLRPDDLLAWGYAYYPGGNYWHPYAVYFHPGVRGYHWVRIWGVGMPQIVYRTPPWVQPLSKNHAGAPFGLYNKSFDEDRDGWRWYTYFNYGVLDNTFFTLGGGKDDPHRENWMERHAGQFALLLSTKGTVRPVYRPDFEVPYRVLRLDGFPLIRASIWGVGRKLYLPEAGGHHMWNPDIVGSRVWFCPLWEDTPKVEAFLDLWRGQGIARRPPDSESEPPPPHGHGGVGDGSSASPTRATGPDLGQILRDSRQWQNPVLVSKDYTPWWDESNTVELLRPQGAGGTATKYDVGQTRDGPGGKTLESLHVSIYEFDTPQRATAEMEQLIRFRARQHAQFANTGSRFERTEMQVAGAPALHAWVEDFYGYSPKGVCAQVGKSLVSVQSFLERGARTPAEHQAASAANLSGGEAILRDLVARILKASAGR